YRVRHYETLAAAGQVDVHRRVALVGIGQRAGDRGAERVAGGQQLFELAVRRGEGGLHRGVGEEQRAARAEERHGVLEVVDDRLERRALAVERAAVGGKPRRDGLERVAERRQLGDRK